MNILVLGGGGREHAITWKFSQSPAVSDLFIAPGNAGTGEIGVNVPELDISDFNGIFDEYVKSSIDFVFVGPEAPLAEGIVDFLQKQGVAVIGPEKKAACLEASKAFAKRFMTKHGIPTAGYHEFSSIKGVKVGQSGVKRKFRGLLGARW